MKYPGHKRRTGNSCEAMDTYGLKPHLQELEVPDLRQQY